MTDAHLSTTSRFSIVCIGRNVADCVTDLLTSVYAQSSTLNFEFIFVDDFSTDDTVTIVTEFCNSQQSNNITFNLVQHHTNMGINGARNSGVKSATTDFILICDSDDILSSGWADLMFTALESGRSFVCGQNIEFGTKGLSAQPRALVVRPIPTNGAPTCAGNNIGFTRRLYDRAGGFPPEFPVVLFGKRPAADDTTFCWYVWLSGFMLHPCPEAIIHYRQPDKLSIAAKQQFAYGMGSLVVDMLFNQNFSLAKCFFIDMAYLMTGLLCSPWILLRHGKFDFVGRMARRFGRVVLLTLGQRNPHFFTVLDQHRKITETVTLGNLNR
jgi:glycosyltransferase involved in cell wall biosynthesis